MEYLIKKLSNEKNNVKKTLFITFCISYISINILMVFLFGISNLTNETLSDDDLTQFIALISSMILIIGICIIFLQCIISIEIKTLFDSRRVFNINIRLMGLSSKDLKKLYFSELISIQKKVIIVGIVLTLIVTKIISIITEIPNTNIFIMILSLILYSIILIVSLILNLNKLVKVNIVTGMRENKKRNKMKIISYIMDVLGCLVLFVYAYMKINNSEWSNLFLLLAIFLLNERIIFIFNKVVLIIADKFNLKTLSVTERILLSDFGRVKNSIFLFSFGIMLFFGLQILFNTTRYHIRQVGEENLLFSEVIEKQSNDNEGDKVATIEKKFTLKNDDRERNVKGIGTNYLDVEKIIIDKNLSEFEDFSSFDNEEWNGVIVPNGYIGKDNVGQKITLTINNQQVDFVIQGGYYQNMFQKNIWLVGKKYLQKELGLNGQVNMEYIKNSPSATNLNGISKEKLIDESVDKVTSSTEPVLITSIIVILVAVFNILNSFILQSNKDTLDIIRLRSMGLTKTKVKNIYRLNIFLILFESFALGLITAVLFAQISLNEILSVVNVNIVLQVPNGLLLALFVFCLVLLNSSFVYINKKAFESEFINSTRYNTF